MLTTKMIDMKISLVNRPFTINIIILNVFLNKSHVDIIYLACKEQTYATIHPLHGSSKNFALIL